MTRNTFTKVFIVNLSQLHIHCAVVFLGGLARFRIYANEEWRPTLVLLGFVVTIHFTLTKVEI